jgi:hypothetical protein
MIAKSGPRQSFSLARWSRRKLEAAKVAPAATPPATGGAPAATAPTPLVLPPVESLTFASDFAAYLHPEVDEQVKRAALQQLFRDPRFNVMDGLDTYIGDYTQADPIAPDVLAGLLQRGLFGADRADEQAAEGAAMPRPRAAQPPPACGVAALVPAPVASGEEYTRATEAEEPHVEATRVKPTGAQP